VRSRLALKERDSNLKSGCRGEFWEPFAFFRSNGFAQRSTRQPDDQFRTKPEHFVIPARGQVSDFFTSPLWGLGANEVADQIAADSDFSFRHCRLVGGCPAHRLILIPY